MNARKRNLIYIALAVIALTTLWMLNRSEPPEDFNSVELEHAIVNEELSDVAVATEAHSISGTITHADGTTTEFVASYPKAYEETLVALLADNDVAYTTDPPPSRTMSDIVFFVLQILAMGAILFFAVRLIGGGGQFKGIGSIGKTKLTPVDRPSTGFSELGGLDEAIEEVQETVAFLQNPEIFYAAKAKPPKGVLLEGPPGTGKTALARAVAAEAGVPFYSVSGSDFIEIFAGVGAGRVRELFEQARENAPSIVFIDEIDAIGRQRGGNVGGSSDEREQTLNQLLVNMDGFDEHDGIVVMAATNRSNILDKALVRPGRFDRRVMIPLPDRYGREKILHIHSGDRVFADDVDMTVVAAQTIGFSGAELESLINEASILAARDGETVITRAYMEAALERVLLGYARNSANVTAADREIVAYHEAGHTLVAWRLSHAANPRKVTIIPRGGTGGATWSVPKDSGFVTVSEMLAQITVSMGGRAGESMLLGGDITSGAAHDIKQATRLAHHMIGMYGMNTEVGPVWLVGENGQIPLGSAFTDGAGVSDATALVVEREIKRLLTDGLNNAVAVLQEDQEGFQALVDALLEFETLSDNDLTRLLGEAAGDVFVEGG